MNQIEKKYLKKLKSYKRKVSRWYWFVPYTVKAHGLCEFVHLSDGDKELARFLNQRFYVTGLNNLAYPFGEENYNERMKSKTQHRCLVRRAWVDAEIARFEKL